MENTERNKVNATKSTRSGASSQASLHMFEVENYNPGFFSINIILRVTGVGGKEPGHVGE